MVSDDEPPPTPAQDLMLEVQKHTAYTGGDVIVLDNVREGAMTTLSILN